MRTCLLLLTISCTILAQDNVQNVTQLINHTPEFAGTRVVIVNCDVGRGGPEYTIIRQWRFNKATGAVIGSLRSDGETINCIAVAPSTSATINFLDAGFQTWNSSQS